MRPSTTGSTFRITGKTSCLGKEAELMPKTRRRRMSAPLKYYYLLQARQEPSVHPSSVADLSYSVPTGCSK